MSDPEPTQQAAGQTSLFGTLALVDEVGAQEAFQFLERIDEEQEGVKKLFRIGTRHGNALRSGSQMNGNSPDMPKGVIGTPVQFWGGA